MSLTRVFALDRADICVSNAGIVRTGSVLHMAEEDWDSVMGKLEDTSGTLVTQKATLNPVLPQSSSQA